MSMEDKTKVVKKYVCSTCHGTGQVTCSKCGGKGERKCPHCDGTGHACPVCSRGYVKKKRLVNCSHCYGKGYTIDQNGGKFRCYDCGGRGQIEETYKEICPNCHGDYKNTDHVCDKCDGHKKISCAKHEECPDCNGKGKWSKVYDKASDLNIRMFLALGMIGGLFGLHYAYVRRWLLFAVQLALFAILAVLLCGMGMIAETFNVDPNILSKVKWGVYWVILLNCFTGMALIKRDGQCGTLKADFKKSLFWLCFIPFGFMGAHLAYGRSKLLVIHAGFLVLFSLSAINWGFGTTQFSDSLMAIFKLGCILSCIEFIVASIFSGGQFYKEGN